MSNCDGTELHDHYSPSTSTVTSHKHLHTINAKDDFNIIHHHAPKEHLRLNLEELNNERKDFQLEW